MTLIKAVLFSLLLSITTYSAHADIRVGTVFLYPPFVMSSNQGFDIEFIRLLCQRMNTPCTFVPMDFNQLFTALDNGSIDIAVSGLVISEVREQKYIFSLPYMLSKGQFLISKNNNVDSLDDLKGQKIGVIRGGQDDGVFMGYLKANYPGFFEPVRFDDIEDLITALSSKSISAAFVHESTALYWEQNGGGQFKTLGNPTIVGDGIAIMASPQKAALIQQFNQQIQATEQDGSYLSLYKTYFGAER